MANLYAVTEMWKPHDRRLPELMPWTRAKSARVSFRARRRSHCPETQQAMFCVHTINFLFRDTRIFDRLVG